MQVASLILVVWNVSIPDPPYQTIDDTSADDFRKQVDLNLIGYYLFAKVGMVTKVDIFSL